jgi:SARP family transcriptional regulator, regulator of embCAB operon
VPALPTLHAAQVVPGSALIGELWTGRPPHSARTTRKTRVLPLRELITLALEKRTPEAGPGRRRAKGVLVTEPGGYMLVFDGDASDAQNVQRLAGMGCRAFDAGGLQGRLAPAA